MTKKLQVLIICFVAVCCFQCKYDEINPNPKASFSIQNNNCKAPCVIQFQNSSQDAASVQWDFGDGGTSTDANPSHTYTSQGTYTVKLTAFSEAGQQGISNQSSQTVTIDIELPTISSLNPTMGRKDNILTITGQNFGNNAANLTVRFAKGVDGSINSVSNTQLEVVVPPGAGSGPISIIIGGASVQGPEFTYLLSGTVSTFAGSTGGFQDGPSNVAKFFFPYGIATDNDGNVYVGDLDNARVRIISPNGQVSTYAGGTSGYVNGASTTARFRLPAGVVVDASGNVYVADFGNHAIRKIDANKNVSTIAGNGTRGFADNFGGQARFNFPTGLTLDKDGNLLIADRSNHVLRQITPASFVNTYAGAGEVSGDRDGARLGTARFKSPEDVAVDEDGNIYITDTGNHKIKKIDQNGNVSTLAGNGTSGNTNGIGTGAQFNFPVGIDVDDEGNVFVGDRYNNKIRIINSDGLVYDLAGDGNFGLIDGPGLEARLSGPFGVTLHNNTILYVASYGNDVIRKIVIE